MKIYCYILFLVFSVFISNGYCADNTGNSSQSDYPELNNDWPYCFEFTWFGPDYDNVTRYNGTCADYLDERRAVGVPCAAPIVISYDGTLPNMQYLWDKHQTSILCKRSINQRCVKYTYYYNKQITNITYSCAKVQHNTGGIINSGCYRQKLNQGYETEVCVCKSPNGIHPPCNKSSKTFNYYNIIIGVIFVIISYILS